MFLYLQTKTLAELQALQSSVAAAYERLITGQAVKVAVDQNGERVEFTATSAANLNNYLTQIGLAILGKQQCAMPASRPIGFYF